MQTEVGTLKKVNILLDLGNADFLVSID